MDLENIVNITEVESYSQANNLIRESNYKLIKIHCGERDELINDSNGKFISSKKVPYTKYILGK